MKRLSSSLTPWQKRALPGAILAGTAFLFVVEWRHGRLTGDALSWFLPAFAVVFVLLVRRSYLWQLADEVLDAGDALLVRRGAVQVRVPLAGIAEVRLWSASTPPRIELRLAHPSRLGASVAFMPTWHGYTGTPLAENPVAADLVARVERARAAALR